jgi:N-acetylglucosamine malate deacetylase 1
MASSPPEGSGSPTSPSDDPGAALGGPDSPRSPSSLSGPNGPGDPAPAPPDPPLDVLAVFAHPDDAELLCGGALARSVDRGERVGILDLTRGELGSRGSPELRAREAEAASRVLGVHVRRNVGLPDGRVDDSHPARRAVAAALRQLRPRVVVTHWLEGRHPDHRAAARLVTAAAFLAGLRNLDAPGEPFRPVRMVHAIAFREDAPPPSFVVDVTDTVDRKLAALACFESQFSGARAAGEVYPRGDRPLEEQIRSHLAVWGSRIRRPFGEPFWVREPWVLDTLGEAGNVTTF